MDEDDYLYDDYDDEPERVIGRCEDCYWVEDCPDACGGEDPLRRAWEKCATGTFRNPCDDFTEVN